MKDLFIPESSEEIEVYAKGGCLNDRGFKGGLVHNYLIDEIRERNLIPVFNHKRIENTLGFTCLSPEGVNLDYFGVYLGDVHNEICDGVYRENLLVLLPDGISEDFLNNLETSLFSQGNDLVYNEKEARDIFKKIKGSKIAKERLKYKSF